MRIGAVSATVILSGVLGITVRSDGGARPALEAESREYVRLAVALGERDPDSIDFYAGPPELVADVRADPPSLTAIAWSADAAIDRLERARDRAPDARRQHLRRELRALRVRASILLGDRPAYDVESASLFGVALPPPEPARFADLRARIAALVPAAAGELVDRYEAYDQRFIIPAGRVPAVFARALAECRNRTLAHLQLPAGEDVAVEYVRNKPWSAYSRYRGRGRSVISLNTDFSFTIDRLLQAACHEGYPGHHVRNVLREAAHPGQLEYTVQPLFSPETTVAEGSAMYANEIAFSETDRIAVERDQLFPLAGITSEDAGRYVRIARLIDDLQEIEVQIARQYVDGTLEFARAASTLETEALMRNTTATLKYINEFRSYVAAYTAGRRAARRAVESCAAPDRADRLWRCFEQFMTTDIGVPSGSAR